MKNIQPGQYLLHVASDDICLVWSVVPLQVANLATLEMQAPDKGELQTAFLPVSAEIVYEID